MKVLDSMLLWYHSLCISQSCKIAIGLQARRQESEFTPNPKHRTLTEEEWYSDSKRLDQRSDSLDGLGLPKSVYERVWRLGLLAKAIERHRENLLW